MTDLSLPLLFRFLFLFLDLLFEGSDSLLKDLL